MSTTFTAAALRVAVQAELRTLRVSAPILRARASVDKVYEVYILACLTEALRSIGARLSVRNGDDVPTRTLIFRLKPGLIYTASTGAGHIVVKYRDCEYEIHCGLRVLGRSQVLHELDVCLIDRGEAVRCRLHGINPASSSVKFLAECKYYGATLPLHLGREYLGLCTEFTHRVKTMASNSQSEEIRRLITRHKGTENFGVTPSEAGNRERLVKWLAHELKQVLG